MLAAWRKASSTLSGASRIMSVRRSSNAAQQELAQVYVDGEEVNVPQGCTVMQACETAGIDIPRFCYHPRLSIAGNCRMCLVEVEKSPKPVASCAAPIRPGMNIKTTTQLVKKAREGVMEFLLANHPLDCPICDQGGECDLQDQSMVYGSDRGRFTEIKRGVEDKELGPLIKTVMTRCIHCTRCVRFATEVAGVEDLGMVGRGNQSEIGTYVSKLLTSELSGNVIDLCPVGALTSKPYAFTARPWELKSTESVDVMDGLGSGIRIDTRGTDVMRIVPRVNEEVNEEWIGDKSRFAYDGLTRQRLDRPLVRREGALEEATWTDALSVAAEKLRGTQADRIMAKVGSLCDAEAIMALKDLMARMDVQDMRIDTLPERSEADARSSYLFNSNIIGLEEADAILLVGTNPRREAPVLNSRLRRAKIAGGALVGRIGPEEDLTFEVEELGDTAEDVNKMAESREGFYSALKAADRPMIIAGSSLMRRDDNARLLAQLHKIADEVGAIEGDWNGFNLLSDNQGQVSALDLGFVQSGRAREGKDKKEVCYLMGAEKTEDVPADAFVIYQGSHGDQGASRADLVLPGAAYTEKPGTYVNTEGRAQRALAALTPIGNAREDWKLLRALSEFAQVPIPYSTLEGVRNRIEEVAPHVKNVEEAEPAIWLNGHTHGHKEDRGSDASAEARIESSVPNYFQSDVISRASVTMARCVQARRSASQN